MVADANGCADQAHPAGFADRSSYLHIHGKSALMPDRICAQPFHLLAGARAVISDRLITADLCAPRQAEYVVHTAGPGQGVVGKIALPASRMVQVESTDLLRLQSVYDRAVEDMAKLELSRLLEKR